MAGTWVFVEQKDGNIRKVTYEMLSECKKGSDEVAAVVFGQGVEGLAGELAKYGADKVYVADDAIFTISEDAMRQGLARARHPGRLEYIGNLLLDGAHNVAGAKALGAYLDEFVKKQTKPQSTETTERTV